MNSLQLALLERSGARSLDSVTPTLWVGDLRALAAAPAHGIRRVVSLLDEGAVVSVPSGVADHLLVPLADSAAGAAMLATVVDQVAAFRDADPTAPLLVHCAQGQCGVLDTVAVALTRSATIGQSRSVAVAMGLLRRDDPQLSVADALARVRSCRPSARPIPEMLEALQLGRQ